jgi:hypothetical protein
VSEVGENIWPTNFLVGWGYCRHYNVNRCLHWSHVEVSFSFLVLEKRIVDMAYHLPFLCFSVDDILLLLSCILTQQRIIFLASDYSLLAPITEVSVST